LTAWTSTAARAMTPNRITPPAFVAKWKRANLSERSR
jgi:hypothetical protein